MTPPLSLFYGFIGSRIVHPTQSRLSYYHPSCHMMDYIVHTMNMTLCDSFHFKRANPDYHPYILRLYCGILFWIQCLRAGNDVYALTNAQQNFLNRFLDNHPLETLTVPGPLLGLFKTLCSSQPEFPYYGKVYPHIPSKPGPSRRDVPGIFALLEDLNRLFSQDPPIYPKKGKHIPVTENAVSIFGHKTFRVHADRTEPEKWSLVSPGLQYPCEADQKLNESFAERYDDFVFPVTAATDNLEKISSFFQSLHSLKDPAPLVTALHMAWLLTKSWFVSLNRNHQHALRISVQAMSLATRALSLPQLTETAAAFSQTHIRMFPNHPFLARFGSKTLAHGPFWNRRPIGSSLTDSSYLTIPSIVKQAFKFKGSAS